MNTPTPIADEGARTQKQTDPAYHQDSEIVVSEQFRELLEKYSGIASEQVIPHILQVRQHAWKICPYPCIGRFHFLNLSIRLAECYPAVIDRLKHDNHTLLDLGCCLGQDIRKLVFDGAPAANLYASDLLPEYFDLGYDIFRDRETLQSTFIASNVLDDESALKRIEGKLNFVHIGWFLHIFGWDDQIRVARRLVQLLVPLKGSMVFGRQLGKPQPGDFANPFEPALGYGQDAATFKKMWQQVGAETGTSWKVDAVLHQGQTDNKAPALGQLLTFMVIRQ